MRRGFTLIEMMISIVILGLVVTLLSATLGDLRMSQKSLEALSLKHQNQTRLITLLQDDILSSTELNTTKADNYTLLTLRTTSSLYALDHPYVRWFVNPETKALIRSESSVSLTPPFDERDLHKVHLDQADTSCEWFKIYAADNNRSHLLSLKCQQKELLLELLK